MIKFEDLVTAHDAAVKNKRRSKETIKFQINVEKNLLQLYYEICNRTYKPINNYTFVVTTPKPEKYLQQNLRIGLFIITFTQE